MDHCINYPRDIPYMHLENLSANSPLGRILLGFFTMRLDIGEPPKKLTMKSYTPTAPACLDLT